jgi:hypothetical protein
VKNHDFTPTNLILFDFIAGFQWGTFYSIFSFIDHYLLHWFLPLCYLLYFDIRLLTISCVWLIDWYLTWTLAIFHLYRGVNKCYF